MGIQRAFSIQPSQIFIQGAHVGGDTDFDGNGPDLVIDTTVMRRGPKLFARVRATWTETKQDFTRFEGDSGDVEIFNVDQRFPGWNIKSVNGNETFDFTMADPTFRRRLFGHNVQPLFSHGSSLVLMYQVIGDSDGGIFGGDDHPELTVIFHPLEVAIEHPTIEVRRQLRWELLKPVAIPR
ncbi:hypothetical protein BST81_02180 [Leptolyngbya sp. 'hensonii']|uniref:hypothetical protein n=1 Tax=Leptolyngbya sp. 'hensonii' TaxID=1922337 RepID=UPI00094FBDEA|nr:hypothetical protein [Leptolyngbya sp. 'hensonii']OLP20068.1 hypothetical protein BST81_02180 [Leptolyngbya sp. 'hensonii']